ncbi:MAG: hypothetical protein EXR47_07665 [Dehalococcoidia bacterium]|nr:hypothetical protein [Dehalococcoidia bacterium]
MPEKYQEEIEAILHQHSGSPEGKEPKRGSNPLGKLGERSVLGFITPGRVLLASLALLLVGFVLRGSLTILMWIGILVFIISYAMFFVRWGAKPQKRWRGRPVKDRRLRTDWRVRFRSRFRL